MKYKDEILHDYRHDESVSSMARRYGCSRQSVHEFIKSFIPRPRNAWSKHAWKEEWKR